MYEWVCACLRAWVGWWVSGSVFVSVPIFACMHVCVCGLSSGPLILLMPHVGVVHDTLSCVVLFGSSGNMGDYHSDHTCMYMEIVSKQKHDYVHTFP